MQEQNQTLDALPVLSNMQLTIGFLVLLYSTDGEMSVARKRLWWGRLLKQGLL
jgi:hypothetical protein